MLQHKKGLQDTPPTPAPFGEKTGPIFSGEDQLLYRNWSDVTVEEMKGMLSVILNIAIVPMNNLKGYTSTDDTCNLSFFR